MELVQRQPSRRRIGEIHEREAEPGARRPEVLAREPVDRDRSEPDSDGLDDKEHVRARPDPPQRREQGEDRVDVRAEARHLVALQVGDLEQVAVGRRPHRLHHVPEIEAAGRERLHAGAGEMRVSSYRHGGRPGRWTGVALGAGSLAVTFLLAAVLLAAAAPQDTEPRVLLRSP